MSSSSALKVRALFEPFSIQGRQHEALAHFADDIDWTIMGSSPWSRKYKDFKDFSDNTLKVLSGRILTEPLRLKVANIVGSVTDEIDGEVVVELEAIDAVCKNGLKYDMRYIWVCLLEKGKIVRVRAYLDTDLLTRAIEQNP